jgi:hypothetical protein
MLEALDIIIKLKEKTKTDIKDIHFSNLKHYQFMISLFNCKIEDFFTDGIMKFSVGYNINENIYGIIKNFNIKTGLYSVSLSKYKDDIEFETIYHKESENEEYLDNYILECMKIIDVIISNQK